MRLLLIVPLLVAAAVVPRPGHAQSVAVRAQAQTLGVDCGGNDAEVGGGRNTLTFSGACRSLIVRGDGNNISVALAPGARIGIEGSGNFVRYTVAGGGRAPAISISGGNTNLAPSGATAPAAPSETPVRISGDSEHVEMDCTGQEVDIAGNRSFVVLHGGCHALSVMGESNTVQAALEPGAKVDVQGNGTNVSYTVVGSGAEPNVSVQGNDSHAVRGGAMAMATPPRPAPSSAPPAAAPPAPPPAPSLAPPKPVAPPVTAAPAPQAAAPPPAATAPSRPPVAQAGSPPPASALAVNTAPVNPLKGAAATPPPRLSTAPAPQPGVPQLMHDLDGKVVEAGTLVRLPSDAIFDANGAVRDDAAGTLGMLAALINQIHPTGLRITGTDTADGEIARQRAQALQAWLAGSGHVTVAVRTAGVAATPPHLDVLILR